MFSLDTDLSKKYSEHWFEQLIDGLTIKEGKEKYLKNQINYITNQLSSVSKLTSNIPKITIQEFSNATYVSGFWYGGSFNLGVYIKESFDIDAYIIYREYEGVSINYDELNGEDFFTTLHDDLSHIHSNVNENLELKAQLPCTHAIPVALHYQNKILKIDCIPAIELPNNFLLVPDGWKHQKKVNLKNEESGLKKLNKRHHGNGTKLILLLKFWNWRSGKPVKSYIIQRLVEDIFMHSEITGWKDAVRTFFKESVSYFKKYDKNELILKDRIYTHRSILKDYKVKQVIKFNNHLRRAFDLVKKNQWEQLFGK